ncbi:MAG: hypothetical protein ACFFBS_09560 [Promethearchaeota archaeon]
MGADYIRLTECYLALWKSIDLLLPGHHWLEISPESRESLLKELRQYLEIDISWAPDPGKLKEDLGRVLAFHESIGSPDWLLEVQRLRDYLQQRSLEAAEGIE